MRSQRFVAGLAMTAALIAGCSSKHEANDSLPSASETSSSAELQPLGPPDFPVPDEARTQDAAGAEAFMRYYLDLYNYSTSHLDSTALRSLSVDCMLCTNLANQIDETAADDYSYSGGRVRVTAMAPASVKEGEAQLAFSITEASLSIVDGNNAPVADRQYPERTSQSCGAILRWSLTAESWLIHQLDVG